MDKLLEFQITEDRIKKYFEDFGEVESVEIQENKSFQSCFVQFKDAESANSAINRCGHRMHGHRIEDCKVNVRAAHLLCQPDLQRESMDPLWIPFDQDSPSHILNALNDDCLRKVFKHLNANDLSSAAEVCVRFNQQVKCTFAQKYESMNLSHDDRLGAGKVEKERAGCIQCRLI